MLLQLLLLTGHGNKRKLALGAIARCEVTVVALARDARVSTARGMGGSGHARRLFTHAFVTRQDIFYGAAMGQLVNREGAPNGQRGQCGALSPELTC